MFVFPTGTEYLFENSDLANFAAVQSLETKFGNNKDTVICIPEDSLPVCRKTV